MSTVEALANALEANDEYTSSHTRWITDMALRVGRELGFDAPALKRLELGALFHDIGKIGVPTSILLKPGPLTPDERRVIETHPELGERILEPIARLAEVRTIVRGCHERWDGKGYPDGKAGERIPVEARIIFVCDAFHAMTTDRPYRKRLTVEEARRRLREAAGTQFDPAVVEVFLVFAGVSGRSPVGPDRLVAPPPGGSRTTARNPMYPDVRVVASMRNRLILAVVVAGCAGALAAPALASQLIARDASHVHLSVNSRARRSSVPRPAAESRT